MIVERGIVVVAACLRLLHPFIKTIFAELFKKWVKHVDAQPVEGEGSECGFSYKFHAPGRVDSYIILSRTGDSRVQNEIPETRV